MGKHRKPAINGGLMTMASGPAVAAVPDVPEQSPYAVTLRSLTDHAEFRYVVMVDTDNTLHMVNRARLAIEMDNPDRENDLFTLVSIYAVP